MLENLFRTQADDKKLLLTMSFKMSQENRWRYDLDVDRDPCTLREARMEARMEASLWRHSSRDVAASDVRDLYSPPPFQSVSPATCSWYGAYVRRQGAEEIEAYLSDK